MNLTSIKSKRNHVQCTCKYEATNETGFFYRGYIMNTIICIFFVFFSVEYPEAKELYTNAIKICPDDFTKEKSVFYANRAACLVKMVCSYDSNFV